MIRRWVTSRQQIEMNEILCIPYGCMRFSATFVNGLHAKISSHSGVRLHAHAHIARAARAQVDLMYTPACLLSAFAMRSTIQYPCTSTDVVVAPIVLVCGRNPIALREVKTCQSRCTRGCMNSGVGSRSFSNNASYQLLHLCGLCLIKLHADTVLKCYKGSPVVQYGSPGPETPLHSSSPTRYQHHFNHIPAT